MSTALQVPTPPASLKLRKRPSPENVQEVQPLKKLQIVDSTEAVCASAIADRMRNLFPEHDVQSIPCKAARLFACFTLVAEQSDQVDLEKRESRRSRSAKHVKPILSFLSALALAEKTSLGSSVAIGTVQFSGFDCSSMAPPVDSLFGSHQQREAVIDALSQALDQAHALQSSIENKEEVATCLQSMIQFLRVMEKSEGADLRLECSKTMPSQWPAQRFKKAAKTYRMDFEKLVSSIVSDNSESIPRSPHLFLEIHLAESLGQAIRFYLRAFFNPVPWKQTPGNEVNQPAIQQSRYRSRVSDLLVMKLPEGVVVADTAIADGAISSVFSTALRIVYLYFGADAFLTDEYRAPFVPDGFCASDASQRGPGKKRKPITDEAVRDIVSDIHEAQSFRDAAVACRFLSNLMNFPGVHEEIEKVCGWGCVERHAKKFRDYGLIDSCPNDAHLILLYDAKHFFERIDNYNKDLGKLIVPCERRLEEMALHFKCGPKHKRMRSNYPELEPINSAMEDGFVFPAVAITAVPKD